MMCRKAVQAHNALTYITPSLRAIHLNISDAIMGCANMPNTHSSEYLI